MELAKEPMRLFAQVKPPDTWRESICNETAKLRERWAAGVNWTRPEQLHATVRFFGSVPDGSAHALAVEWEKRVEDAAAPLALPGPWGCFPEHGPERIVWAGLSVDERGWQELLARVDHIARRFDLSFETGNSMPHITVGRVKVAGLARGIRKEASGLVCEAPAFAIDRVELVSSVLGPSGPQHQVIATLFLGT
jgi:2'-5' RNA ligase